MSLSFLSATILQALHSTIGDGWIVHSCLVLFVLAGFILCFIEIVDYLDGNCVGLSLLDLDESCLDQ